MQMKEKATPPQLASIPQARQPEILIELFEPSTPTQPHRSARRRSWIPDVHVTNCTSCHHRFTWFIRRHHCRRCGRIFCFKCTNNRLTHLYGPDDHDYYRLCDACIDDLLATEQTILIPTQQQCMSFSPPFRRVIAVTTSLDSPHHSGPNSYLSSAHDNRRLFADGGLDDLLIQLDGEVIPTLNPAHSASEQAKNPSVGSPPLPFSPIISPDYPPTRESIWSRLAVAALSLPKLMSNGKTIRALSNEDGLFDFCPICSLSFRRWSQSLIQEHVSACIMRTEKGGLVQGNHYSVHKWRSTRSPGEPMRTKECSICFEEFDAGQLIAVLDCFCQFHAKCIKAWFERGKCCPFHFGS